MPRSKIQPAKTSSSRAEPLVPSDNQARHNVSYILRKASYRALKGGIYGATAGSLQVLTLMWLRTVINYQYRYGVSMSGAMRQLYAEGGITRFYQGVTYALIQNPLSKFGSVAANEGSRALLL
ncbi:hypothetical protein EON64_20530, partial [archaeon]